MLTAMRRLCAVLIAVSGASPGAAFCASPSPEELVQSIYSGSFAEADPGSLETSFSHDLAEALALDRAQRAPQVIFDFRWNAELVEAEQLLSVAVQTGAATQVVAAVEHQGWRGRIVWSVCQRPDGAWRIFDVASPDPHSWGNAPWSLRAMLGLPEDMVDC